MRLQSSLAQSVFSDMSKHISVLTDEIVSGLNLRTDSVVVDCTLGSGGHADAVLAKLGTRGTYIGIDVDQSALDALAHLHDAKASVHLVNDNFRNIEAICASLGVTPNAILADLGWRSEQFMGSGKGFSFNTNEPLSMTYGDPEHYPFTARDIANDWEEESIADIVHGYGEERFARRIAHAIVEARAEAPIETTTELAGIVLEAIPAPFRYKRIHPATKTFQAFRIAVNDELGALRQLLTDGFATLAPKGRMAIISFHSLEDRLVKQFFVGQKHDQTGTLITKRPLTAATEELTANPRARSAKLRIIEKT